MDPIIGGALIGAGGDLLGGLLGSSAQDKATKAQLRMFREGQNFNTANYLSQLQMNEPWRFAGQNALNQLLGYFGMPQTQYQSGFDIAQQALAQGQAANTTFNAKQVLRMLKSGKSIDEISQMGRLLTKPRNISRLASKYGMSQDDISQLQRGPIFNQQSQSVQAPAANGQAPQFPPGYNFFREEGQRDLLGGYGAAGGAFSGNALRGLSEFNQNYAGQKIIDPLFRLAGFGSQATANNQNASQQFGQNQMYANQNMADVRGSGIANQGNIWGNAITNAAGAIGYGYANRQPRFNPQQFAYDSNAYMDNQFPRYG